MYKPFLIFLIFFFVATSLISQQETKTFLLSKNEFKKFEGSNTLLQEALKNAFGESNKQNSYKLDIKQVLASNKDIQEFVYFPSAANDTKKPELNTNIINSKENSIIKLNVIVNPAKSELNDAVKQFINKKNAFNLQLVVVGDERIFVKENKIKTDFFSLIDDHAFADRAIKSFFGDPKKNKLLNQLREV